MDSTETCIARTNGKFKLYTDIKKNHLHKNIMDNYRYIVQNYSPGDQLYLFGFSRGAYTIRCLCGLINI